MIDISIKDMKVFINFVIETYKEFVELSTLNKLFTASLLFAFIVEIFIIMLLYIFLSIPINIYRFLKVGFKAINSHVILDKYKQGNMNENKRT